MSTTAATVLCAVAHEVVLPSEGHRLLRSERRAHDEAEAARVPLVAEICAATLPVALDRLGGDCSARRSRRRGARGARVTLVTPGTGRA